MNNSRTIDRIPESLWLEPGLLFFCDLEIGKKYKYPTHQIVMNKSGVLWLSKHAYYESETNSSHWDDYATVIKTGKKTAMISFAGAKRRRFEPTDTKTYPIKVEKIEGLTSDTIEEKKEKKEKKRLSVIADLMAFFEDKLNKVVKDPPKDGWTTEEIRRRRDKEGPKPIFYGNTTHSLVKKGKI